MRDCVLSAQQKAPPRRVLRHIATRLKAEHSMVRNRTACTKVKHACVQEYTSTFRSVYQRWLAYRVHGVANLCGDLNACGNSIMLTQNQKPDSQRSDRGATGLLGLLASAVLFSDLDHGPAMDHDGLDKFDESNRIERLRGLII